MPIAKLRGFIPGSKVTVTQAGQTTVVRRYNNAPRLRPTDTGLEGRVLHLTFPDAADIVDTEMITQPAQAWAGVTPDHAIALVVPKGVTATQSFRTRVTYQDGQSGEDHFTVALSDSAQGKGWDDGRGYYYLPKDTNNRFIAEPGTNHRTLYVATDGMDAAAVATHADANGHPGTTAAQVNTSWLLSHPEYGGSEALALDESLFPALWMSLTRFQTSSHHLLLKRGQHFAEFELWHAGARGESARHPVLIGAYGTGTKPLVDTTLRGAFDARYVVIQDIELAASSILNADYCIQDHVHSQGGFGTQNRRSMTYHYTTCWDVWPDAPSNGTFWRQFADRTTGFYCGGTARNILIEGGFWDLCGWNPATTYPAVDYPANPGMPRGVYSHAAYFNEYCDKVTVKSSIFSRGSFGGLKMRSGGVLNDSLLIDNGAHLDFIGGAYSNSDPQGMYSLNLGNIQTSGVFRPMVNWNETGQAGAGYAVGWGTLMGNPTKGDTIRDFLACHMADPNNPAEIAAKTGGNPFAIIDRVGPDEYNQDNYSDVRTTVYGWGGTPDMNVSGIPTATLNGATIQRWFDQEFGTTGATIDSGMSQMRSLDEPCAKLPSILSWFRSAFNLPDQTRTTAASLRFFANDIAEGLRWDNRVNWSTEDLPGRHAGDTVDLAGFDSVFGCLDITIADLDLSTGALEVDSGKLRATGAVTGSGRISAQNCGWLSVASMSGQVLHLSGAGRISAESTLTLGPDTSFSYDAERGTGFGQITGAGCTMGGTLSVNTTGAPAGTYDLIDVTTLSGSFEALPPGVTISGGKLQVTVV